MWGLLYGFESRVKSSELFFWVHAICYIRIFPLVFLRGVFFLGRGSALLPVFSYNLVSYSWVGF